MTSITKKLITSVCWVFGKLWAFPYTFCGLIVGFAVYLYSWCKYDDQWPHAGRGSDVIKPRITFGNNAIQFENLSFPGRANRGAITIGNTILYFLCDSSAVFNSYCRNFKVNVGRHEGAHTNQYELWGIFFVPVYFWRGGAKASNPMEQEADEKARVAQ